MWNQLIESLILRKWTSQIEHRKTLKNGLISKLLFFITCKLHFKFDMVQNILLIALQNENAEFVESNSFYQISK